MANITQSKTACYYQYQDQIQSALFYIYIIYIQYIGYNYVVGQWFGCYFHSMYTSLNLIALGETFLMFVWVFGVLFIAVKAKAPVPVPCISVLCTVDRKNFVVKKVAWNKSSARFNFVKAESIVCTSTKELC